MVDLPDMETREEILKVTMSMNRVDEGVNFTTIAAKLEGYTGSDIKEVCREAVVRISNEQAKELDRGGEGGGDTSGSLREVRVEDFEIAMKKLSKSVSETGREIEKIDKWNEEYGEIKRKGARKGSDLLGEIYL